MKGTKRLRGGAGARNVMNEHRREVKCDRSDNTKRPHEYVRAILKHRTMHWSAVRIMEHDASLQFDAD